MTKGMACGGDEGKRLRISFRRSRQKETESASCVSFLSFFYFYSFPVLFDFSFLMVWIIFEFLAGPVPTKNEGPS